MDTLTTVRLSEVFGPTWQGEGPHAGRRVGFVRLGLCNLHCEWCDTAYTWDRTRYDVDAECPATAVEEVHRLMAEIDVPAWVLSGGEPLVHHKTLAALLDTGDEWHVETNGTIAPPEWWLRHVVHTSVSPKVNTVDPQHRREVDTALAAWTSLAAASFACFKFVARDNADLDAVAALCDRHAIPAYAVWIMPEGRTADALIRRHKRLAPRILLEGWNTTTRLHVLLYDDERGR